MPTATKTFEEYQREKSERDWKDRVLKQKAAMGNKERVARATEWKRIGNDKFKAGNNWEARDYYREAILYIEDLVDALRTQRTQLLMPLYTNLAQVHLRVGEHALAAEVCEKALAIADVPRNEVQPSLRAKAHFRRAVALRMQENLEAAQKDLVAALALQPHCDDISQELVAVREQIAEHDRKARLSWGGFLKRGETQQQSRVIAEREKTAKQRAAQERRAERRARVEQRQQMQEAFQKLAQGDMLYAEREKEMEPVRAKEKEKQQTLELERDLRNVIDESKGSAKVEDLEKFVERKHQECRKQGKELGQKKKVLDKLKKEEQWDEDDNWKRQRDAHRLQVSAERAAGTRPQGPPSMWESKEVARWCEQRLRDMLLGTYMNSPELEPDVAAQALQGAVGNCGPRGYMLRSLVTDIPKLEGDAAVVQLNANKAPLHYFDYFIKLDWEVAIVRDGERCYRSADELITVASKDNEMAAPPSVTENRLAAGTFKIKEFCSEEGLVEDGWRFSVKVKAPCGESAVLNSMVNAAIERLREKAERLLVRWAEEYKSHWGTEC